MNPKAADASAVLARAGLPDPLHPELRAPPMASPDETWRELQARLDAARPGRKRTWVVGAVAAAVVAVLVLIGGLTRLGWRTELATQRQTTPASSHEFDGARDLRPPRRAADARQWGALPRPVGRLGREAHCRSAHRALSRRLHGRGRPRNRRGAAGPHRA